MEKLIMMSIKSQALEVNLASYHVDVSIDERYLVLREIMHKYHGLMERFDTFLKELSHPYKNWRFIVKEARTFSLDYFRQLQNHEKGPDAAELYAHIFSSAVKASSSREVKTDAADNLLLFLSKIARESDLSLFSRVINNACDDIRRLQDDNFFVFVNSYYPLENVAAGILKREHPPEESFSAINRLLVKYLETVYQYWQGETDCLAWFRKEITDIGEADPSLLKPVRDILDGMSHKTIGLLLSKIKQITGRDNLDTEETCRRLIDMPGFGFFVSSYRKLPEMLYRVGGSENKAYRWKLLSLFLILSTPGLALLHEESLREINSTLGFLISNKDLKKSRELIKRTFLILKKQINRFPITALNCVLNIGKSVYRTDDTDLINYFISSVIELGFHPPMVQGVDSDWKIKVNKAHLHNIRTWLALVRLNPQKSSRLLSALIVHLSISGVFVRDIDLFPRDITELLNSDTGPVYNLIKQLTRLTPVFFNDIGAEGALRDISTEIDELSHRKDVLVHFLRKQGHVEGSNRLIDFMETAIAFWMTKDKSILQPYLPPEMFSQVAPAGDYVDGMHELFRQFESSGIVIPKGLLEVDSREIDSLCRQVPDVSERDRKRAALAVAFYKLLDQKYNIGFTEIDRYIDQLDTGSFPDLEKIKQALAETSTKKKISGLINYLNQLKKLILSDKTFEIQQNIYEKRHITVDIPSMYGSYRETKFDALGLTFRLEALVNVLFEEIIDNINLNLITKTTFFEIYNCLKLLVSALSLDGCSTKEIDLQLELLSQALKSRGFSFSQFLDIFKRLAKAVQNIINDHFHNIYSQNLARIIPQLPTEVILDKYLPESGGDGQIDRSKLVYRISEIFYREKIALSFGMAQLDLFLTRILQVLFHQQNELPPERLARLLNYDPARIIARIDEKEIKKYGIIHLGNKGFNLISLKSYGCPVPPGFIITTEVFKCREIIDSYKPAEDIFKQALLRHLHSLEKETGKIFGNPKNPLLLSVRSGASISQPGMMDTSLNVGINEAIAGGLAEKTGNTWFAWDNYRRFIQCYGMAFGLSRDTFSTIMTRHKKKWNVQLKRQFSGEQMKALAKDYRAAVEASGIKIVDDPFEQLYATIKTVFDSWYSKKAQTYRKIVGISDDWGTAVTVQAMIYGNLTSQQSGSGVIFTHSPKLSGDNLMLWGDFTIGNQGEDVVAGLVTTLPISVRQKNMEQRKTDITLETQFPEIYKALTRLVSQLIYDHGWNPQEIEFTFEGPEDNSLYLLQTRNMTIREQKSILIFDPEDVLESERFLGHGIGVSGGAMSGRIVFTLEEIQQWSRVEPDTNLILVRRDTVPDDILELSAADGLLTARGGLSSHAAVLAHSLGKTCVVGCGSLICNETEKTCLFNNVLLSSGDYISIDGSEGAVYQGLLKTRQVETPA
jgi:pyruvate,orthophosphate dikinase